MTRDDHIHVLVDNSMRTSCTLSLKGWYGPAGRLYGYNEHVALTNDNGAKIAHGFLGQSTSCLLLPLAINSSAPVTIQDRQDF